VKIKHPISEINEDLGFFSALLSGAAEGLKI
jgi:hypothetical protein